MARTVIARQSPTITAGAYSANDAVGGKLTFSDVASGGSGKLVSLSVSDKSGQGVALVLLLFNQDFTATADNAGISVSAADQLNMIGSVSIATGDYVSLGSGKGKTATLKNIQLVLEGATDNNVYGQLYTTGTPTYTSTSDLQVTLHSEVDRSG